jgi:DNA repair exonuclease SbcCD ATPase subunit
MQHDETSAGVATIEAIMKERDFLRAKVEQLETALEESMTDLNNTTLELDVLRVDYSKEQENLNRQVNRTAVLRRKCMNLENDIRDSDLSTIKRHNRLVNRLQETKKEKDEVEALAKTYEQELERRGAICYLCRVGVKTVGCMSCSGMYCLKCCNSMSQCPFCRVRFEEPATESDTSDEELD